MSPAFQTLAALAVVAAAAVWLVLHAFAKRKHPGCGDCGAVSPEVKRLQARLSRK